MFKFITILFPCNQDFKLSYLKFFIVLVQYFHFWVFSTKFVLIGIEKRKWPSQPLAPAQWVISWLLKKGIQRIEYWLMRPEWIQMSQYHHTIQGEFCESKHAAVFSIPVFIKEWHQYLLNWGKWCLRICESNISHSRISNKWHMIN